MVGWPGDGAELAEGGEEVVVVPVGSVTVVTPVRPVGSELSSPEPAMTITAMTRPTMTATMMPISHLRWRRCSGGS